MVNNLRPSLFPYALDFSLWGWMKKEVCKTKMYTRDELVAGILESAARIKLREDQLKLHAIFTHELHIALKLNVRFWNIYCEL